MTRPISLRFPISAPLPARRHAVVVMAFTLLLSVPLQRISGSPYLEVFGHVGCVGAILLVAYSAAVALRPRWLGAGSWRFRRATVSARRTRSTGLTR